MGYFLLKAALSGMIIAIVSEVARRAPGLGALIASLPLISSPGHDLVVARYRRYSAHVRT